MKNTTSFLVNKCKSLKQIWYTKKSSQLEDNPEVEGLAQDLEESTRVASGPGMEVHRALSQHYRQSSTEDDDGASGEMDTTITLPDVDMDAYWTQAYQLASNHYTVQPRPALGLSALSPVPTSTLDQPRTTPTFNPSASSETVEFVASAGTVPSTLARTQRNDTLTLGPEAQGISGPEEVGPGGQSLLKLPQSQWHPSRSFSRQKLKTILGPLDVTESEPDEQQTRTNEGPAKLGGAPWLRPRSLENTTLKSRHSLPLLAPLFHRGGLPRARRHTIESKVVRRVDVFKALPLEITMLILEYVEPTALANLCLVSRFWYQLIQDPLLWKHAFLRKKHWLSNYGTTAPIHPVERLDDGCDVFQFRSRIDSIVTTPTNETGSAIHLPALRVSGINSGVRSDTTATPRPLSGTVDPFLARTLGTTEQSSGSSGTWISSSPLPPPPAVLNPVHRSEDHPVSTPWSLMSASNGNRLQVGSDGWLVAPPTSILPSPSTAPAAWITPSEPNSVTGEDSLAFPTPSLYSCDESCAAPLKQVSVTPGTSPMVVDSPCSTGLVSPSAKSTEFTPPLPPEKPWKQIYQHRYRLERRWDETGPKVVHYLNGHSDSVYCLQFHDNLLVTGSRDRTIRFWDLSRDYACTRTLTGHGGSVLCLKYDDQSLVTGSSDYTIMVWDVHGDRPTPIHHLRSHVGGVLDVAMNDQLIISSSKDCTIKFWNRTTAELLGSVAAHRRPVNAIQVDGPHMVSASGDGIVKLWDIETGKFIRDFEGHLSGLACVQFRENCILSGSNDKTIKVWDPRTSRCVNTLTGHQDLVRTLYYAGGNRLVSGSYDQTVKIWDMAYSKCNLSLDNGHSSWVFDVQCDLTRLISAGQDQKILVWDFAPDMDPYYLMAWC
ncbi:hypothetical protein IWQ62_004492 [Dispira parvispora]|uniref:F-box domain-containing protein n=1 Tax=Dispira parvispora TaxID=1520584 RepID=A0A9W8E0L4_9FUNG|nr:hypothetical protein IWQ62_004492 [Dispira parvispora]